MWKFLKEKHIETSAYLKTSVLNIVTSNLAFQTILENCFELKLKGSKIESLGYLKQNETVETYLRNKNLLENEIRQSDDASTLDDSQLKAKHLKSNLSRISTESQHLTQLDYITVIEFQNDDQRDIEKDVIVIYTWFSIQIIVCKAFEIHFENLTYFLEYNEWKAIWNSNVTKFFCNDKQNFSFVQTKLSGLNASKFDSVEKMAGKTHPVQNKYIFEATIDKESNQAVSKIFPKLCSN